MPGAQQRVEDQAEPTAEAIDMQAKVLVEMGLQSMTLEEMNEGFTPEDAASIRARTRHWLDDKPAGAELM